MTSKLWKTFGAKSSLFEVYSPDLPGDGVIHDDEIHSISIDAGTTMAGLSTSAAEIQMRGYHALDYTSDKPMRIDLSPYGRDLLSGPLGVSADHLRSRFHGRIAGQTITDHGADRLGSKLTVQDWGAFISQLDAGGVAARDDPTVWRLYLSMFVRSGIPRASQLDTWGSTWHWVKWDDQAESTRLIPTSDVVGKFAADLGNFISVPRNGYPRVWSHDHLIDRAEKWWENNPHPLQRSQVLKPVEWTRNVSIPVQTRWEQWNGVGADTSIVWTFPPPNNMVHKVETIDLLHIVDINSSPGETGMVDVMAARTYRQAATQLSVEKVTIDILGLYRRNQGNDRALVGQLLTMSHGDPLALGWDWPAQVNGIYFAQRIAHSITPSRWTIDLDLVPARHVTGHPSPSDIYGETWQTATPPSTEWHLIAEPTTWEWNS